MEDFRELILSKRLGIFNRNLARNPGLAKMMIAILRLLTLIYLSICNYHYQSRIRRIHLL
jgi:hypothetical protein